MLLYSYLLGPGGGMADAEDLKCIFRFRPKTPLSAKYHQNKETYHLILTRSRPV